jgi:hypothetical protein
MFYEYLNSIELLQSMRITSNMRTLRTRSLANDADFKSGRRPEAYNAERTLVVINPFAVHWAPLEINNKTKKDHGYKPNNGQTTRTM